MADLPIRPGIVGGQTFEELLARNLSMDGSAASSSAPLSSSLRRGGSGAGGSKPGVRFADEQHYADDQRYSEDDADNATAAAYSRGGGGIQGQQAPHKRQPSFSDQFRALDPSLAASDDEAGSTDGNREQRYGDDDGHFEDAAHEEQELHYDEDEEHYAHQQQQYAPPPPSRLETSFPLPSMARAHPLSPLRESSQEIDTERLRHITRDARDEDSGYHDGEHEEELLAASDDGGHDDGDEPQFQTAIYTPSAEQTNERNGSYSSGNSGVNTSLRQSQEDLDEFERLEQQAAREAEEEAQGHPHQSGPVKRLRPSNTQLNNSLTRQQMAQMEAEEQQQQHARTAPRNPYSDPRPSAAHSSLPVFDDDEEWTDQPQPQRGHGTAPSAAARSHGAYGAAPPAAAPRAAAPAPPAPAGARFYDDTEDDLDASASYSQIRGGSALLDSDYYQDEPHAADEYERRDPLSMAQVIPPHATAAARHAAQQPAESVPPTSNLVKKFFKQPAASGASGASGARPSSAPAKKTAAPPATTGGKSGSNKKKPSSSASASSGSPPSSSTSADSRLQLSAEVERYQKESAKLRRLNKEQETELAMIRQEVAQSRAKIAAEREELERAREEDARKTRALRLQLDKERRALSGQPDRREREMIDSLTKQVTQLQEELQAAQEKFRAADLRARKEKEQLQEQVRALKAEMVAQEQRRIDEWEKREAAFQAQVDAQRKRDSEAKKRTAAVSVASTPAHGNQPPPMHHPDAAPYTPAASTGRPHSAHVAPTFTPAVIVAPIHTPQTNILHSRVPGPPNVAFNNFMPSASQQGQPTAAMHMQAHAPHSQQQQQQQQQHHQQHPPPHMSYGAPPSASTAAYAPSAASSYSFTQAPPAATAASSMAPPASALSSSFPARPAMAGSASLSQLSHAPPPPSNRGLLERGSSLVGTSVLRESAHPGGKLERFLSDGSRLILFKNATSKRIFSDGLCVVSFPNGDKKHTESDGRVLYFYAAADTLHTTYPDGTQLYEFRTGQQGGQVEQHQLDGKKIIWFADGTVKSVDAQGGEEAVFPDGTVQRQPAPNEPQHATAQHAAPRPYQR